MAFFKNGYVYHTKFDRFPSIPLGSVQNVGDNMLSLITNIANSNELTDDTNVSHGSAIYFDVLGLFMVSYSEVAGLIINILALVLSFAVFVKGLLDFRLRPDFQKYKILGLAFGIIILGWICSVCFVIMTAIILDSLRASMSWYTNIWMAFGLYVTPTVALSGFFITFLDNKNLSINAQAQLYAHITRILWTVVLLIGIIFKIRSSYTVAIPVMFNSVAFAIIYLFRLQHSGKKWLLIYLVGLAIPTVLIMSRLHIILSLFIPITGRMGSNNNVDIVIGLIASVSAISAISPYLIFMKLVHNARYLLSGLLMVFLIFFIMVFTPLGFPYGSDAKSPTPQRHWVTHSNRVVHAENGTVTNRESGYFVLNMDRNSPYAVEDFVKDFKRARFIKEDDCKKFAMCGVPLPHSKVQNMLEYSSWIPAGPPIIREHAIFKLHSKDFISTNIMRLNVTVTGPDRIAVYLVPLKNTTVIGTSLIESPYETTEKADSGKIYHIVNTSGKEIRPVPFTFDVKVPDRHEGPVVDFVLNTIYVHPSKMVITPHFQEFINSFPDWADVTACLGTYESWKL